MWKICLFVIKGEKERELSLSIFSSHLSAEEIERKRKGKKCSQSISEKKYKYITLHRGIFYRVQIEYMSNIPS
jgi:hypothetical protein